MSWKLSLGFLFASLLQAVIVAFTEFANISTLDVKFSIMQLLLHIVVGQIAGYILFYLMEKVESLRTISNFIIGTTFGLIVWAVVLSINIAQDKIKAPWTQGFPTLISSIIAFWAFGLVVTYTIKTSKNKITTR